MKKVVIGVTLLICAVVAAAYYLYDRVSYQPDWYAGGTSPKYRPVYNVDELERKIIADLKEGKSVQIPTDRIIPLIANRLEHKTGLEIQKAIKATRSKIKSNEIEMEMIVDVRRMTPENLPEDVQKVVKQFLKIVPENALSSLYLKCDLQLDTQNDSFGIKPASGISIGKMNLPWAELEKKFGSNLKIPLDKFPVSDFEFKENKIILKPSVLSKKMP